VHPRHAAVSSGVSGVTWVRVDAVGVDVLGGGLSVGLGRQGAEAVHPDLSSDAGHSTGADAGWSAGAWWKQTRTYKAMKGLT